MERTWVVIVMEEGWPGETVGRFVSFASALAWAEDRLPERVAEHTVCISPIVPPEEYSDDWETAHGEVPF